VFRAFFLVHQDNQRSSPAWRPERVLIFKPSSVSPRGRGDLPQIQVLPARKYHSKSAMVAMLFGSLSATETIHSRIRLTKTPHPHQPPTSRPALTKTQPQPQHLNQFSPFVLRRAVRGSARVQPPHGHSPSPVSTSPQSKTASTRHRHHVLVSRQRQNPCTPAHGSPKKNPESFSLLPVILLFSVSTSGPGAPAPDSQRKKLRVFMVNNPPQISATTHQRTEISTQNFSKNFANCSLNNATCASTIQE